MKKYYGLALLVSCSIRTTAQTTPCSPDNLMEIKGSWKKDPDFLRPGNNYTPAMKPEIFKRQDQVQQVIRSAYPEPKGTDVFWYRQIYGTPLYKSGAVTYCITNFLLFYYCDMNSRKWAREDESSTGISVYVNNFDRYVPFDTTMKVGHLYAAFMYPRVGKIGDVDMFQISLVRVNERFAVVSRAGQLPYIPLTRKQYLLALKGKLEREKQSRLDRELPYRKDESSKNSLIDYVNREFDPKLKAIDDYLTGNTEDDLNQTAFVKTDYDIKFTDEKKGGRMIVILNTDYFNRALSPYTPQMMVVFWRWDDGEGPPGGMLKPVPPDMNVCCKVSKYFKESIEQNLDVNALRQLLDQ